MKPHLLIHRWYLLSVSSPDRRGKETLLGLFYWALFQFNGTPSPWGNQLPNVPPSKSSPQEVGISTTELDGMGGTNIQTIPVSYKRKIILQIFQVPGTPMPRVRSFLLSHYHHPNSGAKEEEHYMGQVKTSHYHPPSAMELCTAGPPKLKKERKKKKTSPWEILAQATFSGICPVLCFLWVAAPRFWQCTMCSTEYSGPDWWKGLWKEIVQLWWVLQRKGRKVQPHLYLIM